MVSSAPVSHAWHQQPVVWLVLGILGFTMVASFWLLYLAVVNAPDLVVEDYSRIQSISAERSSRLARARDLQLAATLRISDVEPSLAEVEFNAGAANTLPDTLLLRLQHSTRAEYDRVVLLERRMGNYIGYLDLPPGGFEIALEDQAQTWLLIARGHAGLQQLQLRASGQAGAQL